MKKDSKRKRDDIDLNVLTVAIMRKVLSSKKLSTKGKKTDLIGRLEDNLEEEEIKEIISKNTKKKQKEEKKEIQSSSSSSEEQEEQQEEQEESGGEIKSFFDLECKNIDGENVRFSKFKDSKAILVVNVKIQSKKKKKL